MCAQWRLVLFYVVAAAVVVLSAAQSPRRETSLLGELLRNSLQKTTSRLQQQQQRQPPMSLPANSEQLSDLENIFQRIRKQAPPAVRCGGGSGRNPYECNDGLMGVWLRLMKNPDYSD